MIDTNTAFAGEVGTEVEANDNPVAKGRKNKILVVIDMQVDFVMRYGRLPVKDAERTIIPGIGILVALDSEEYVAVLFTYDTHTAKQYIGSLENIGDPETGAPGFVIHCEKDTPGWELVLNPQLVPVDIPIYQLEKDVFDMFQKDGDETLVYQIPRYRPGAMFDQIGRNRESFFDHVLPASVDTAVVIGVASDFCVKDAIVGLLKRGLKVEVIERATAGILREIAQVVAEEFPGRVKII